VTRGHRNLSENPHCILTTGRNNLDDGLGIVVEGGAAKVTNKGRENSEPASFVCRPDGLGSIAGSGLGDRRRQVVANGPFG
jgi:hypothetical protein